MKTALKVDVEIIYFGISWQLFKIEDEMYKGEFCIFEEEI
jgi:hypothetical protein